MPKATLQFDLPEEWEEFYRTIHGPDIAFAISDLDQRLRSMEKYEGRIHVSIDELRQQIRDLLEGIDILR